MFALDTLRVPTTNESYEVIQAELTCPELYEALRADWLAYDPNEPTEHDLAIDHIPEVFFGEKGKIVLLASDNYVIVPWEFSSDEDEGIRQNIFPDFDSMMNWVALWINGENSLDLEDPEETYPAFDLFQEYRKCVESVEIVGQYASVSENACRTWKYHGNKAAELHAFEFTHELNELGRALGMD